MAPLGARGADLVVWWDEGFTAEEAEGAAAVVDAFEQESGKKVDLVLYPQLEFPREALAALEANRPPDLAFGVDLAEYVNWPSRIGSWTFPMRSAIFRTCSTRTPSTG
jgi:ABC-type glycerol-3-phosphate transport system substrate-binding protein